MSICVQSGLKRYLSWSIWDCHFPALITAVFINVRLADSRKTLVAVDRPRALVLPLIAPAMASGWLLAFTLSLDDLVIASFTAGPSSTTLPIKIFSSVRLGVSPEINALSTILIGIVTVGVLTASLMMKRQIARQRQDERLALQ